MAERLDDTALRGAAMAGLALIRFNAGKPGALRLAEQARELVPGRRPSRAPTSASRSHTFWSGRPPRAGAGLLESLYREWSESDERMAAYALWYLALVELRSGRLSLAGDYAERARNLSGQYARAEAESPTSLLPLALVAAHRGDLELARASSQSSLQAGRGARDALCAPTAMLGVVDLWSGESEAAVAGFAAAERIAAAGAGDGFEPSMCWWRADQVEALLELGLVDDAVGRLDAWEADGRRLRREWVLAHATRCRGLVAASRGDVDEALSLLADAVTRHEAVGDPSARHARFSPSVSFAGGRGRSARRARRSRRRAPRFEEMGAVALGGESARGARADRRPYA